MRVLPAGAAQQDAGKRVESEVGRIKPDMLAGEDQGGRESAGRQGDRNRLELDGFGPGPEDQPDVCGTQPSP
jgi:hypothetical protein